MKDGYDIIISPDNSRVKLMHSLHRSKGRREHGMFLLEGERLVYEAITARAKLRILVVSEGLELKFAEEIYAANKLGAEVIIIAAELMNKVCDSVSPQGIAAAVQLPASKGITGANVVALDGLSDPGNMGTILRTAQAFGCKSIVLSEGCTDPYSPKCVRSGMGAHFKLDISYTRDMADLIRRMKFEGDYTVVGGHLAGFEHLPEMSKKRVAVIGSEANGMTDEVARQCSALWRIPMAPYAESLNASVAAGIMMYKLFSF